MEKVFYKWKDNERDEGHALSVLSLKSFYEWLSEPEPTEAEEEQLRLKAEIVKNQAADNKKRLKVIGYEQPAVITVNNNYDQQSNKRKKFENFYS
jgi:hypothetical protein